MSETAVALRYECEAPGADVGKFIMAAIDKNVPVETMERLLSMREKLRAEHAKAEYDNALAEFQAECPVITKEKTVNDRAGKPRYRYAPLDAIIAQIKGLLQKYGFSYSMTAQITSEHWVEATCKATHRSGHSEFSSFRVPIDKDAFMNEQQKVASALTYAKRYAFCNAFGIMTGDEDDDSNANEPKPPDRKPSPRAVTPPPPPPPVPPNAENSKKVETGSSLHKRLEATLSENGIDRELFKEWLESVGWLERVDGRLSYSNMTEKRLDYVLGRWESAAKTFGSWVDKRNAA